jgi:outer membrane protein OmpU
MSGARIDREDRMKKFLLGTTALIAAGAFVGAAQAADDEMMAGPVTVGVAGYSTAAIGFASDSSDTTRGQEINYVYEFGVSGSTTLDNGITVAVHAQVGTSGQYTGSEDSRPFDEQHITMSGSFGSLRIGRTESAAFNSTVAAPGYGIGGMIGVNYVWFSTAAPPVNTYHSSALGNEDAMKLVYTTPNFNGLTIGASYAPNNSDATFTGRSTAGMGEHTAVGMKYSTGFMEGGSFTLGAGFETAAGGDGGDDPSAMRFGANISVDQISFGGSMLDLDGVGMQYDVGASWTEGATELGLQYGHNEVGDAGSTYAHLTYTLGPGVLVGGQIAAADDVTQFMLGTAVFF